MRYNLAVMKWLLLSLLLLTACIPHITPTALPPSPLPRSETTFNPAPLSEPTLPSLPLPRNEATFTAAPTSTPPSTPLPPTQTPLPPIPLIPFPLSLPVIYPDFSDPFASAIDPSYRFASTQGGAREPHHGVEFLLPFGSPVLAAGDGKVLFAGDDAIRGPYGPPRRHDYFGNFVVLEHPASLLAERGLGETAFYTVYAHLSELNVQTGDPIRAGDPIGRIGFTGAALGPHLHFEVRLTGFTYADSFNPELFVNLPGQGVLAGRFLSAKGDPLLAASFNLTYLDAETPKTLYITTYENAKLTARPPYNENFGLSLPPGPYELTYILSGIHTIPFEIRAGEITFLEITVGE